MAYSGYSYNRFVSVWPRCAAMVTSLIVQSMYVTSAMVCLACFIIENPSKSKLVKNRKSSTYKWLFFVIYWYNVVSYKIIKDDGD